MRIRILAVGPKMPSWVNEGAAEYIKRMPRELPIEFSALPLGNRSKNQATSVAIAQEGDAMLSAIKDDDHVVALDLAGKNWSTLQLAEQLQKWRENARDLAVLIGGPDGLDARCLARANQTWSLSALTLPHPLVRVFVD